MTNTTQLKKDVETLRRALVANQPEDLSPLISEYMEALDKMTAGMTYPERTNFERQLAKEATQEYAKTYMDYEKVYNPTTNRYELRRKP